MGVRNKEIFQRSALQRVLDILYRGLRAMSHAAIKQGGIRFSDKQLAFACLVRYAVNVPFHSFNYTRIPQK
jgi:hypothetical protein